MFEFFRDYIWYLLPSFFKRVKKGINQWWIFAHVMGAWFDECLSDMERARDETTIATCSDIMLRYHGEDRGLVQYSGEANDTFRGRIAMYDEVMSMGGTSDGIILAVNALGYDNVDHVWIPELTGETERWAEFCIIIDEDIANEVPTAMENVVREVRFWKEPESLDNYLRIYHAEVRTKHRIAALYEMMAASIFYSGGRKLNGGKLLDGSKLLDGAAGKVEALTDYLIKVHTKLDVVEDMKLDTTYRARIRTTTRADPHKDTVGAATFYQGVRRLDGKRLLDGSRKLYSHPGRVELFVDYLKRTQLTAAAELFADYLTEPVKEITAEPVQSVAYAANFWRCKKLDGSKLLDGTQLLNQQAGHVEMLIGNTWP